MPLMLHGRVGIQRMVAPETRRSPTGGPSDVMVMSYGVIHTSRCPRDQMTKPHSLVTTNTVKAITSWCRGRGAHYRRAAPLQPAPYCDGYHGTSRLRPSGAPSSRGRRHGTNRVAPKRRGREKEGARKREGTRIAVAVPKASMVFDAI
jgi:hypothetical protein